MIVKTFVFGRNEGIDHMGRNVAVGDIGTVAPLTKIFTHQGPINSKHLRGLQNRWIFQFLQGGQLSKHTKNAHQDKHQEHSQPGKKNGPKNAVTFFHL